MPKQGVTRRIVACVNACNGIPTEMLEQGVMVELLQACKEMAQYFYGTMNPGQMPTVARQAFDTFTKIEAEKVRRDDAIIL
jgi:hypothetical protein